MITPRFTCTQTAEHVVISVYCPSVRASDVEIHVDDTLVSVHINPYFLRLNFSHSLLEDDASSARYDPSDGYLTITLTKQVNGQHFDDLDLLAKLLAPRPVAPQNAPTIEVLSELSNEKTAEDELIAQTEGLTLDQDQEEFIEAAQNDWQLPQTIAGTTPISLSTQRRYGFLDNYTGYFVNVSYTENEVNELGPETERCNPEERRSRRTAHEDDKWDVEHYMADFAEDEYIQDLLQWEPSTAEVEFTEKEKADMLNLPRKEYRVSRQTHNLYLTLLTVLFAYAYDSRTTQHDPTPESPWTLSVLIPAFSALDPPPYSPVTLSSESGFSDDEVASTLVPSYRRSLSFPLYRSFALAEKCREDTAAILSKGKRAVFRCLFETKGILDHHEVYYIYSKIWLDDFCTWIQSHASDETLSQLASVVRTTRVRKESIGWDLDRIEQIVNSIRDGEEERDSDSDDDSDE